MRAQSIVIGDGKVLHLLSEGTSHKEAQTLASSVNMVRALGVEAPHIYAVMERDGRPGLVLDMPSGVTYSEWLRSSPFHWNRMVSLLAHEAHEMHLHTAPELPKVKELMRPRLLSSGLLGEQIKKLTDLMDKLPDGENVCNWNYIPENIIVSYDGPKMMVWDGLRCGPYLADVARTVVLLMVDGEDTLADAFRKEYLKICGRPDDELDSWSALVAADMMADRGDRESLILGKIVRKFFDHQ